MANHFIVNKISIDKWETQKKINCYKLSYSTIYRTNRNQCIKHGNNYEFGIITTEKFVVL